MAAWSSLVPDTFQRDGFSNTLQSGLIRTDMETGNAKQRRRFTATTRTFAGNIIMTTAELAYFETWFDTVVFGGALAFDFPHPVTGTTTEMRFKHQDPIYQIDPDGDTGDWRVSFTLEVII